MAVRVHGISLSKIPFLPAYNCTLLSQFSSIRPYANKQLRSLNTSEDLSLGMTEGD